MKASFVGRLAFFYFTDGGFGADGGFKPCTTVTVNADRVEDLIARKLDFPSDDEVQPILTRTSQVVRTAGEPEIVRDRGTFVRITVEEITEAEAYADGFDPDAGCCGDEK